jgi:hypothetical protein
MSDDIIRPKINLKEQEVTMIKKVPALLTGSPEDTIVPFPTYMCNECGHVNADFELFID